MGGQLAQLFPFVQIFMLHSSPYFLVIIPLWEASQLYILPLTHGKVILKKSLFLP